MPRPGTAITPAVRHIAKQLMILRGAAGLRQADIAERIGSHTNHVSRLEKCSQSPQSELLDRWANAFGLTLTVAPVTTALLETTADMGAEIRHIRRSMGLTLEDVAAAAGIAATNLSGYENDRRKPDPDTLLRIVAALGCRLAIVGAR